MYIGHVGDSRCYRVRQGQIQQLTRDHSLINDYLLAMPDLTEEQRSELPKNVITRALGMQDQVVVDLQHDDPRAGDVYVLCSDGLSGMVQDEDIRSIISSTEDVREACSRLIAKANEHGGEDNITAVLIRIEDMKSIHDDDPDGDAPTREIEIAKAAAAVGAGVDALGIAEENTAPGVTANKAAAPPPPAIIHPDAKKDETPAAAPAATGATGGEPQKTSPQAVSPAPAPAAPAAAPAASGAPATTTPSGTPPGTPPPANAQPGAVPPAPTSGDLPPPPPASVRPKPNPAGGGNNGGGNSSNE
jgi:hypothetical protein